MIDRRIILQAGIREIDIPKKTREWLEFRRNGIGASEMATILGLSPYAPTVTELWRYKVGIGQAVDIRNQHVLFGGELEPLIVKMAKYWDGSENGYIDNYYDNRLIRDIQAVDSYIINDQFPHIFVSLDAFIPQGCVRLDIDGGDFTGEELWIDHPLECKNISGYNSRKWVSGIPIMYYVQLQTQMIALGVDYGELAVLVDNSQFSVYPFQVNEVWRQRILEKSEEFWDSVLLGRKALAAGDEDMLAYLEPQPNESEAYTEYYSEEFKRKDAIEKALGGDDEKELCNKVKLLMEFEDVLDETKQLYKNRLTKSIVDIGCEKLTFPNNGYIRYAKRSNSKNYSIDFRGFKPDYPEELVEIFTKSVRKLV